MTERLPDLKFYHWILLGAGLLLIGWLGFSLYSPSTSQPAAAETLPERPASVVMEVRGMYCASCERNVRRSMSHLDGVEQVAINLEQEEVRIWIAESVELDDETLQQTITQAGYEPGEIRRP